MRAGLFQEKQLLLRYVAFNISDLLTWKNFALVSRFCWSLNREYTKMKKRELAKTCVLSSIIVEEIPYLPGTGAVHGFLRKYYANKELISEIYYIEGVKKWTTTCGGKVSWITPCDNHKERDYLQVLIDKGD